MKTPKTDNLWMGLLQACNESNVAHDRAPRVFAALSEFQKLEKQLDESVQAFELVIAALGDSRRKLEAEIARKRDIISALQRSGLNLLARAELAEAKAEALRGAVERASSILSTSVVPGFIAQQAHQLLTGALAADALQSPQA
jgi:hypothetical protein